MTVARFQDAPGRTSGPVRLPELSRPLIAGQRGVSPEFNYTFVPHGWNAATWPPSAHAGTHRETPFHSAAGPETIAPQPLALCLDPASVVNFPRRTRPPAHRRAPRPGRSPLHRRRKHLAPHRLAPPRLQARALSRRPSPPRRRTRRAVGRPPRKKSPASSRPPSPRPTRPHPGPRSVLPRLVQPPRRARTLRRQRRHRRRQTHPGRSIHHRLARRRPRPARAGRRSKVGRLPGRPPLPRSLLNERGFPAPGLGQLTASASREKPRAGVRSCKNTESKPFAFAPCSNRPSSPFRNT